MTWDLSRLIGHFLRNFYLGLNSHVIEPWILPRVFSPARLREAKKDQERLGTLDLGARGTNFNRIWFHAASVGELESLWPLISISADRGHELIITILSESAHTALANLVLELSGRASSLIFSGYSPWEGHWGEYLDQLKPTLLVTARYEAWPDLWMSLSQRQIPLGIIAARDRRSLRLAEKLCRWMSQDVPQLFFFSATPGEREGLQRRFPKAQVKDLGDPRWDRVHERSQRGNPRASALVQAAQDLPRPWGVLGSAWMADLAFLFPGVLQKHGTLWIVPHRVEEESVLPMEAFLMTHGVGVVKTRGLLRFEDQPQVVLVNEMGFLSELYSAADWAWVGGGFGQGIHSTLEPALQGVPIGTGPRGTSKFSEVEALSESGQLAVLSTPNDLELWIQSAPSSQVQNRWKEQAQARLGAGERIFAELNLILKKCSD